jgi:hypothetical protein
MMHGQKNITLNTCGLFYSKRKGVSSTKNETQFFLNLPTGKWGSCSVKYFSLEKGSTGAKIRKYLPWYTAD